MSNTPVREPRLYTPILTAVHKCVRKRRRSIAELSEDLRDHLQISGKTELEAILAMIGTIEQGIARMCKLHGAGAENALRMVIAEVILEIEDGDNAVS
jgi:hypothetical protein